MSRYCILERKHSFSESLTYVFVLFAEDLCGIFVKSVIEGSMADRSGCIMVNDQITQVDGTSLAGISNQQAVEILKNTGPLVQVRGKWYFLIGSSYFRSI